MPATITQPATVDLNLSEVEGFFASLSRNEIDSYSNYWDSIIPNNDSECFQRFLFAYCSVHTSWESNIKAYTLIKDWWVWMNNWELLEAKIIESRAGLYRNRVRFIKDFSTKFWENPCFYTKQTSNESWTEYRDRIEKTIIGLGPAKTSFAIEMMFPTIAQVFCADTHMFQLYGKNQVKNSSCYKSIEKHWIKMSFEFNVAPYVARCIYWDRKQQKSDSRYWSNVLEKTV